MFGAENRLGIAGLEGEGDPVSFSMDRDIKERGPLTNTWFAEFRRVATTEGSGMRVLTVKKDEASLLAEKGIPVKVYPDVGDGRDKAVIVVHPYHERKALEVLCGL